MEDKNKTEIEVSSQDKTESQEIETDPTDKIKGEMKQSSDYLDEIFNNTKKLSGIIACLGGIPREQRDDDDFTNLSWAMTDYTDAIYKLAEGLWDHLNDIGAFRL